MKINKINLYIFLIGFFILITSISFFMNILNEGINHSQVVSLMLLSAMALLLIIRSQVDGGIFHDEI